MKLTRSLLTYQLHLPSNQQSAGSLHDLVWATTFSDLVTLLFCFFLTMVSFGPIGKAVRQNAVPAEVVEKTPVTQAGTSFAIRGEGVQKRVFLLDVNELARIVQGDASETLDEIKKVAISDGYQERTVRITVSPEVENDQVGTRWLSIIQRLSELKRQLFDARAQTALVLRIAQIPRIEIGAKEGAAEEKKQTRVMIEVEDVRSPNG